MKRSLYFLLCFITICCKEQKKNNVNIKDKTNGLVKVNLKNVSNNSEDFLESFYLSRYVKLHTSKETVLGEITSVLFYKERIFIADDQGKIFIYSEQGKIVNVLSPGKGPSEFLDFEDIQYDKLKKELYVWSLSKKEMYVYDRNGNYKRTFNLNIPIVNFVLLNSENIVCFTNYATSKDSKADNDRYNQLFVLNKKNKKWNILAKEFTFSQKLAQQVTSPFGTSSFHVNKDRVFFMHPFGTNVYSLSNLELEKNIAFDFGKNSIPSDFIQKNGLSNIFGNLRENNFMLGWGKFYVDEDFFCFTTILDKNEKTVKYDRLKNKVYVFNELEDRHNQLPIHIISNSGNKNRLLAYTSPFELIKSKKINKVNSLGSQLKESSKKFDNPILLLYERKN